MKRGSSMRQFGAINVFGLVILLGTLVSIGLPFSAVGGDKLRVKDDTETIKFAVTDTGLVYTADVYLTQKIYPGFWLDETDYGKGAYFVLDGGVMQMQRRGANFGAFEASPFKLYINAPNNAFFVKANGYIGLGREPNYPIHSSTNAYLSAAGQWVNASSREYKDNIKELTVDEAMGALKELNPITYTSKADPEDTSAGFIAEDVPEIVATKDRKGLSPMDIVAVLTKVVQEQQRAMQEQQRTIAELNEKVTALEKEVRWNNSRADLTTLK